MTTNPNPPVPEGSGGEAQATQGRIQQLINQRLAAEQEAASARQRYENLPSRPAGDESRYLDNADWRRAVVTEAVTEAQRATAAATAQEAAQRAFQARAQTFEARVNDFKQSTRDFDQVARNPNLQITPAMADAITESSAGPQVSYWLGQNPSEAARIASLPPIRQIAEIGRLEASLGTPPQGRNTAWASSAPRVNFGSSSGETDPEKMTPAEYRTWRATQKPSR
jgi:hypothetical protein